MTTTTPPARPRTQTPALPVRPRPLWERGQLFQEPAFAAELDLLEDEDDDESDGIITS
jgi:hypothetical protein